MTGYQTLLARSALALCAAPTGLLLARSKRLQSIPNRSFDRVLYTAFAVSRLGLFFATFFILHIAPRGDIFYYFDQGNSVLHHLVPYRDFQCSYAPLHSYLAAGLLLIHNSPLSIILFAILCELALLPLAVTVGRSQFPERPCRTAALLYLLSPLSLQFVAIDGQNNVIAALLIAAACALVVRNRYVLSGAVAALSIASVKILPILYAPVFFFAVPKRWRWASVGLAVIIAVYGFFALLHAPILAPLTDEGAIHTAGNLGYVIEAIFDFSVPDRLSDGVLAVCLFAILGLIARTAYRAPRVVRLRVITYGLAAMTLCLLLLSKKSWPNYLMLSLFPILILPALQSERGDRRRWIPLGALVSFSAVALLEHSVWSALTLQIQSLPLHVQLVAGQRTAIILLLLEILLLAGYVWLLSQALVQIVAASRLAPLNPPAEVTSSESTAHTFA